MIKVLVVAQTPPPFLGQPLMIQYLVRSEMPGVDIKHLPMMLSTDASAVGKFRWTKAFRVLPVLLRIIWARLVYRPHILYYCPGGPIRASFARDLALLLPTRWLFSKTVFHFHGSGISGLYDRLPRWQQWLFRRTYFHVDGAVRLSELTPEDGKLMLARREFLVPNGIPDPCDDMTVVRKATPISESRPMRILFVANLVESKGLLVLLDACAKLQARGVPFQLDVVGSFPSQEFEGRVRSLMAGYKLEERVCFHGILTGLKKFAIFRDVDVFCMPTFYESEAFPIVLLEAMACALPIVSTRWRGIPSMVDDGANGFLVETHDPQAVADRLALLSEDAQLRQRMGAAGRDRFQRDYTLPRHIESVRRVLLDVAGQPEVEECSQMAEALLAS